MAIISQQSRNQYYQDQLTHLMITRQDVPLQWEINLAFGEVSLNALDNAIWRIHHPLCHDHELRHCPICHQVPAELRSDYPQEGLQ